MNYFKKLQQTDAFSPSTISIFANFLFFFSLTTFPWRLFLIYDIHSILTYTCSAIEWTSFTSLFFSAVIFRHCTIFTLRTCAYTIFLDDAMQAHCNAHENMEREREREVRMGIKMRRKIKPNAKLHYAWGWRIVLHKNAIVVFLFHAIVLCSAMHFHCT